MDRTTAALSPKMLTVYHPSRVSNGHALDVHGGRHAIMAPNTYAWNIRNPRDALIALGGISCLLPLFPRLLIENNSSGNLSTSMPGSDDYEDEGTRGLEVGLVEVFEDISCQQYLSNKALKTLRELSAEFENEGCIGLLLATLARCLLHHIQYQQDMVRLRGLGMIEYALVNTPEDIIFRESSNCVVALLNLHAAVKENSELEHFFIKRLLCNFRIWSKGSFGLQQSIMSIILAAVRGHPELYLKSLGVEWLFEQLVFFLEVVDDMLVSVTPPKEPEASVVLTPTAVRKRSNTSFSDEAGGGATSQIYLKRASSDFDSTMNVRRPRFLTGESLRHRERDHSPESAASDAVFPVTSNSYKSFNRALFRQISSAAIAEHEPKESLPSKRLPSIVEKKMALQEMVLVAHRFKIRSNLYSAVLILAEQGLSVKEIQPFFIFMNECADATVLNEVAQLLLRLLVDNETVLPNIIMEVCLGIEGITNFILLNLVDHTSEAVRTAGIRLLTHFYRRLDTVSSYSQTFSRRLSKDTLMYGLRASLSPSIEILSKKDGLNRIQSLLLGKYGGESSEITYSSLLEMMVTRPGAVTPRTIYCDTSQDRTSSVPMGDYHLPPFTLSQLTGDDRDALIFMEKCVLPLYLNFSSRYASREVLFRDLSRIILNNPVNMEIMTAYPLWNKLIFKMVSSVEFTARDSQMVFLANSDDVQGLLNYFYTKEVTNPLTSNRSSSARTSDGRKESVSNEEENICSSNFDRGIGFIRYHFFF